VLERYDPAADIINAGKKRSYISHPQRELKIKQQHSWLE
jgi:hypothetical protein